MELLIHLLVVVIVLCILFWVASQAPIPADAQPVRWVIYAILLVIALVVLLPFLGMHLA